MWKVTYQSETEEIKIVNRSGEYREEEFYEWWEVTNGDKKFRCDNKADAEWLRERLSND